MANKFPPIKKFLVIMITFLVLLILTIIVIPKTPHSSIVSGKDIAVFSLKTNYGEKGIYAGQHQFKDYWARDSFFASLGALSIGDYFIVKKNLELFLSSQKSDGQLPLRVGQKNLYLLKFLGIPSWQEVAVFDEDKQGNTPLDQNCLAIIVAEEYLKKTKDYVFGEKNIENLEKAVLWLKEKDSDKNFLVEEKEYAGWTDSIQKKGEVLYTNVCFYKSAQSLGKIQEMIGRQNTYANYSENVREAINSKFWNGQYFDDFIYENQNFGFFSTEGNLLAILWNVSDSNQSEKIFEKIDSFGIRTDQGILDSNKPYPDSLKSSELRIIGLGDYHDGIYWLWISGVDAAALKMYGKEEKADKVIKNMESVFKKYGTVFEVYEKNGMPVQRFFYRSERPFAWSAGMYLYAKNFGNN